MATINAQAPVPTGFAVVMSSAAAGGDSYFNSGNERVIFANSSGGAITVTIEGTSQPDNFGVTSATLFDRSVVVPAGATRYLAGPFSQARHNDAQGKVQMVYSTEVGLTLAVLG